MRLVSILALLLPTLALADRWPIPGGYRVETESEAYEVTWHPRCGGPWRARWTRPVHREMTWRYDAHCKCVAIVTEKGVWSRDAAGRWCLETDDGRAHCY